MNPATLERLWYSDDLLARAVRTAVLPAAMLFRGVSGVRNRLYDRELLLSQVAPALPSISIGNLTVGGTGKTPLAAWVAARLLDAGARPSIVLRGYGGDEPLVHAMLNPGVRIVTDAIRSRGIAAAAAEGADIAVLDDAFQHRRVRRTADLVLVSADRPLLHRLPLPAGPWREPLSALRRATVAIVTRKAADDDAVHAAISAIERAAPELPVAVARLALGELRLVTSELAESSGRAGSRLPISELNGRRVLAVAALGDPRAFLLQLEATGALVSPLLYPDHHAFTSSDVSDITRSAASADFVVCSLKDAVKLASLHPRVMPGVWYVSQTVQLDRGEESVERVLLQALALRRPST